MLAPALYLIVIIGLIATVSVSGVAAAARAAVSTMSERSLDAGARRALARYQAAVETVVTEDPAYVAALSTSTLPQPIAVLADPRTLPVASYSDSTGSFQVEETVTPTTGSAPACAGMPAGSDTATSVQCNSWIQESRASLQIDVSVHSRDGRATLAQRRYLVTLRLFAVPPFSAASGMKDAAALEPASGNLLDESAAPHEDDTGGRGAAVLAPDARYGPLTDGSADTAFHVQYQCRGTNCDQPRPPGPDNLADRAWTNGNSAAAAP